MSIRLIYSAAMTGACLKKWVKDNKKRPEELAFKLGISVGTLYNWYGKEELDKTTVLALSQIGCVKSESSGRQKAAS